jgi:hypothetical protein
MTVERRRLRNRRRVETLEIEHCGLRYTVSFGRFNTGALSEVFISNHKRGNAADVAARDAGILLSFLLQYGCPVEAVSRAVSRNADGSASGVVAAVLDILARESGR